MKSKTLNKFMDQVTAVSRSQNSNWMSYGIVANKLQGNMTSLAVKGEKTLKALYGLELEKHRDDLLCQDHDILPSCYFRQKTTTKKKNSQDYLGILQEFVRPSAHLLKLRCLVMQWDKPHSTGVNQEQNGFNRSKYAFCCVLTST